MSFNFLCYYCCSINLKRQSEHSGFRPDTSSLVRFCHHKTIFETFPGLRFLHCQLKHRVSIVEDSNRCFFSLAESFLVSLTFSGNLGNFIKVCSGQIKGAFSNFDVKNLRVCCSFMLVAISRVSLFPFLLCFLSFETIDGRLKLNS